MIPSHTHIKTIENRTTQNPRFYSRSHSLWATNERDRLYIQVHWYSFFFWDFPNVEQVKLHVNDFAIISCRNIFSRTNYFEKDQHTWIFFGVEHTQLVTLHFFSFQVGVRKVNAWWDVTGMECLVESVSVYSNANALIQNKRRISFDYDDFDVDL